MNEGEKFEQIPFDLVIEILLKLPTKSIARFRCVSKLWDSTFRSQIFTESFFTISSSTSHPKLLITCLLDDKTFFFSSPQPQISSCASTTITASFHMSFPIDCLSYICRPVRGLVYGNIGWYFRAPEGRVHFICNPSTGQFLNLPKVKKGWHIVKSYLGYDPIDKQLKVLCMTELYGCTPFLVEHHVLTLGTGKCFSWRMIECDIPHFAAGVGPSDRGNVYDGICINGVLYYLALIHATYDGVPQIICYNFTSEKFSNIKKAQGMEGKLIEYKGKLAMLQPVFYSDQYSSMIKLWVLEDAEKPQWSRYTYVLPSPWMSNIAWNKLRFVGVTTTGEIVFSPLYITDSFFIVYYNPERNTIITRIRIQGMEAYKNCKAYVFLDHVEDLKLMASI
ncbi:F-box domain [Arabidopsis thaliana x Arabidopsis arenosa]|uniref:F-box domain n=1 Tax=Arabidopsis thaliana x Arabidopsis arenosa TaxID=1240361 RepID=A0A8T2ABK2_9BRAS|nr:F-box domain [Arabidopsis thaliana x Arabidopsis arenosa]